MSSQRSDWRKRLHANPSRMEQELAIKLQDNGIHVPESDHALRVTPGSGPESSRALGDPLASLDLAMLGSAQVVSGLSC